MKISKFPILLATVCIAWLPSQARAISITTADGNGADAYVLSNAPNSNFGSSTTVQVKYAAGGVPGFQRKGYFRFDLSGVMTPLDDATLTLTIGDPVGGVPVVGLQTFSVYGLLDGDPGETWGESTITWNNAPANDTSNGNGVLSPPGSFLGDFSLTGTGTPGTPVTLSGSDLVDFLNADTDDLATFIVVRDTFDPNSNGWIHSFASKENTTLAPATLSVTESVPEPLTLFGSILAVGFGCGVLKRKQKLPQSTES